MYVYNIEYGFCKRTGDYYESIAEYSCKDGYTGCMEEMLYENVKLVVTGLARNHTAKGVSCSSQ